MADCTVRIFDRVAGNPHVLDVEAAPSSVAPSVCQAWGVVGWLVPMGILSLALDVAFIFINYDTRRHISTSLK